MAMLSEMDQDLYLEVPLALVPPLVLRGLLALNDSIHPSPQLSLNSMPSITLSVILAEEHLQVLSQAGSLKVLRGCCLLMAMVQRKMARRDKF